MTTKTVRSRFNHEVGEQVEGCTIVEKRIIAPPNPAEARRGIYDYLVEVRPTAVNASASERADPAPTNGSFTRATPDEMSGGRIRRIPSR
ncbi:MAG: hypothetical protein LAP39_03340 [Acidobacteriia bacterium]|nr:hypothetical protein [Terriglobia bacterium]